MIKLVQKLIQYSNRYPRMRSMILSYLVLEFAFALLEAAWDGVRARAAARMFPVKVGSREAETLFFISWMKKNAKENEGLPEAYIVERYVNEREKLVPGTKAAKELKDYETSFKRFLV